MRASLILRIPLAVTLVLTLRAKGSAEVQTEAVPAGLPALILIHGFPENGPAYTQIMSRLAAHKLRA